MKATKPQKDALQNMWVTSILDESEKDILVKIFDLDLPYDDLFRLTGLAIKINAEAKTGLSESSIPQFKEYLRKIYLQYA